MPQNLKALIVIVAVALTAFFIARKIAVPNIRRQEFSVWRNSWLAFSAAGFLSNNFILFSVIATAVCFWARVIGKAAAPPLFIAILFTVPLAGTIVNVPGVINNLIELTVGRLLSMVLLVPLVIFGLLAKPRACKWPDRFIIAYVCLGLVLSFREANVTSVMRGGVQVCLDVLVPYFAFSRALRHVDDIRKVMLAFVFAAIPLAVIALIEVAKGWPLYDTIFVSWEFARAYAQREGMLRGGASAGPIVLGVIIMVAIGCLLAVRAEAKPPRAYSNLAFAVLGGGLVATLSRGPWVSAVVLAVIYTTTGPRGITKLGLYFILSAFAITLLMQTSFGQLMISYVPFMGTVDSGTVSYRQLLIQNALIVVEKNLFFGSSDYLSTPEMRELITGQQIVDIVNTYVGLTLSSGIVGLGLFLGFFTSILLSLRATLANPAADPKATIYSRACFATLIGILVAIATVSSVSFIPFVYWSFAGVCVALIRVRVSSPSPVRRSPGGRISPAPAGLGNRSSSGIVDSSLPPSRS